MARKLSSVKLYFCSKCISLFAFAGKFVCYSKIRVHKLTYLPIYCITKLASLYEEFCSRQVRDAQFAEANEYQVIDLYLMNSHKRASGIGNERTELRSKQAQHAHQWANTILQCCKASKQPDVYANESHQYASARFIAFNVAIKD